MKVDFSIKRNMAQHSGQGFSRAGCVTERQGKPGVHFLFGGRPGGKMWCRLIEPTAANAYSASKVLSPVCGEGDNSRPRVCFKT